MYLEMTCVFDRNKCGSARPQTGYGYRTAAPQVNFLSFLWPAALSLQNPCRKVPCRSQGVTVGNRVLLGRRVPSGLFELGECCLTNVTAGCMKQLEATAVCWVQSPLPGWFFLGIPRFRDHMNTIPIHGTFRRIPPHQFTSAFGSTLDGLDWISPEF